MFCYIHDPDHTMIELVYHHRREYTPVTWPPAWAPGGPGAATDERPAAAGA